MQSMEYLGVHPLFHSPLSILRFSEHGLLKPLLLKEVDAVRQETPGIDRSNWNGWHSEYDFFQQDLPAFRRLQGCIHEAVEQVTRQLAPNFDMASHTIQLEGWINILGRHGMNTPHDHPGWVWSGCYYLHLPPTDDGFSGNIEFLDVRTGIRTLTLNGASCFEGKFRIKPEEGMLILFPSYLKHWVYPNESEEERCTIAFNARYLPR